MKSVYTVEVIESERGWGRNIHDYMICIDKENADSFMQEFNKDNSSVGPVPDWYMQAQELRETTCTDEAYAIIEKDKFKRCWQSYIKKTINNKDK
jgi:hypothetical protein